MPRDGVVVIDRGWNRAIQASRMINRRAVKVGLRAGPANDGVQVVDYAIFNEFGTAHIPARPFMRHTADTQERPLQAYTRRLIGPMLDGRMGVDTVLSSVGQWYQAAMRRTIRQSRSWADPNAPSTIALKGSSTPLIDQGVLVSSIDFEITPR
ncbi:hypothetical protein HMPREF9946_03140 [Acetobacteraceae bacterium AT-5844]|nr:hypothetical protein HMPREF9946_03140 [Acetobacteraceae bacterium AT-5844]